MESKCKMNRGITLKIDELTALKEALQTLEIEKGETTHGYGN